MADANYTDSLSLVGESRFLRRAKRISKTLQHPARKLSGAITKLSHRTSNAKARVSFNDESPTVHSYPSAQSFVPDRNLWYTRKECKKRLRNAMIAMETDDFDDDEMEIRGLEGLSLEGAKHTQRQKYICSLVEKDREFRESAVKLTHSKKKKADERMEGLHQCSINLTSWDKECAYQMAAEDETQARKIYAEGGMLKPPAVECSTSKSADSVEAKSSSQKTYVMPQFCQSVLKRVA